MKKQKGQILLVTLLVFLSVFALGIALGILVLFELRAMTHLGESVKALYAAESGIEWRLFCFAKYYINPPTLSNDTTFSAEEGNNYIRAVGTTLKTKISRALEVSY